MDFNGKGNWRIVEEVFRDCGSCRHCQTLEITDVVWEKRKEESSNTEVVDKKEREDQWRERDKIQKIWLKSYKIWVMKLNKVEKFFLKISNIDREYLKKEWILIILIYEYIY